MTCARIYDADAEELRRSLLGTSASRPGRRRQRRDEHSKGNAVPPTSRLHCRTRQRFSATWKRGRICLRLEAASWSAAKIFSKCDSGRRGGLRNYQRGPLRTRSHSCTDAVGRAAGQRIQVATVRLDAHAEAVGTRGVRSGVVGTHCGATAAARAAASRLCCERAVRGSGSRQVQ